MLISLQWLGRYLDTTASAEQVADILTMAGFPVVAVERLQDGDARLDVEITSNRPDLQCHFGIAGEVGAALRVVARLPEIAPLPLSAERLEVGVDAPDICPLYTARVIRGVRVGPSPTWLRGALLAVGQRSVNNVVDVTNFVLMECGHPLHAFDLAKLAGPRLVARRAAGETFTAIDGARLELSADDCAISDSERPVALGGVMGGLESEVSDETTDVALECALFAPLAIRAASRRHQIRSESSFRFERFVDPARAAWASDRAAQLLVEVCSAREVGPICRAGPGVPVHATEVTLRTAQVGRVLGVQVTADEIRTELSALGLECRGADPVAGATRWGVPSSRPDLTEEIDLVEEVARRIGFDRIPAVVSIPVRPRVVTPRARALHRLRDTLVATGLRECCTAPFVGEGVVDIGLLTNRVALRVENPMRAEESLLRRSVLGPLLRVVRGNQDRGVGEVRFFETAPVYLRSEGGSENSELLLTGVVLTGVYADVKGVLDRVAAALGVSADISLERGAPRPLAIERSATVRLAGEVLGHLGELHERDLQALGLERGVAVLELRADLLAARAQIENAFRPVSRFPAVERDLAIVLDDHVTWAAVCRCVESAAGALLSSLRPFDVYRGAQVGAGKKSLALRMELRSLERTLTGEEADACVAAVVAAVGKTLGGALRR